MNASNKTSPPDENAAILQKGLTYLKAIILQRLERAFLPPTGKKHYTSISNQTRPWKKAITSPQPSPSTIGQLIQEHQLQKDTNAQLTLLIALAPHLQPNFFETLFTPENLQQEGNFSQIGGWRGKNHRGFLPTGETVLFILAGDQLSQRLSLQNLFSPQHVFSRQRILYLDPPESGEPAMSGKLILSPDYVHYLTHGSFPQPHFSMHFPAQRITTQLDWADLVLNQQTFNQIEELKTWLRNNTQLQHLNKHFKPGYRALFHGPAGTGKTLTAAVLGKEKDVDRDVYKIDLSLMISKYIGETEKNLANLFARAENKGWILFFDEADALFGKRTGIRDAHDKYANQEVSYLLQRIENYNGLVILASNFKSNIDDAFIRRFQAIIHFPMPNRQGRLTLWEKALPNQALITFSSDVELQQLADTYELSGAEIVNVIQYCSLKAHQRLDAKAEKEQLKPDIQSEDILLAIKRELGKAGRVL